MRDEELRELAERATPGPWTQDAHDDTYLTSPTGHLFWDGEGLGLRWPNDADAAYIAAVSPSVVLSLLDRLRAIEGRETALRSAAQWVAASVNGSHDTMASHDHSKCLPISLDMLRSALSERDDRREERHA
ncbi:MAG TPA: hypothetical protein DIT48_04825 [Actinobacteria bacterium]|jgi:hypothetical protein|nr:hypothetical protein [Actinomycetota bacterium]